MDYLITAPWHVGLALKSARRVRGLTQAAVAAKVGLLPKTVSALENHPQTCSVESLLKLLSALDLELTFADKAGPEATQASHEGW